MARRRKTTVRKKYTLLKIIGFLFVWAVISYYLVQYLKNENRGYTIGFVLTLLLFNLEAVIDLISNIANNRTVRDVTASVTKGIAGGTEKMFDLFKKKREEKLSANKAEEERRVRLTEEIARLAEEEERKKQSEVDQAQTALKTEPEATDTNVVYKKTEPVSTVSKQQEPVIRQRKPVEYKLPGLDLLSQAERPTREQVAAVREKGEFIAGVFNDTGVTCDFIEGSIDESLTTIKLNLKRKGDLQRYLDAVDNLKRYDGYQRVFAYSYGNETNTIILMIPSEEGIKLSTILSGSDPNNKTQYALGEDFYGNKAFGDLSKNKNLLITGRGMCGKTTLIQAIITSLIMKNTPDELKLVLADSTVLNYVIFKDEPHLMWPLIDSNIGENFADLIKRITVICDNRRSVLAAAGCKNIESYNDFVKEHNSKLNEGEEPYYILPRIVIVIDEIDSFLMENRKEFLSSFVQAATVCTNVGIHFIVGTRNFDRSTAYDNIRRLFNGRISYAAASSAQSRVALETDGAETLSLNAEIYYRETMFDAARRIIAPMLDDNEVRRVCNFAKQQAKPEYDDSYYEFLTNTTGSTVITSGLLNTDAEDSLYGEAVEFVRAQQKASTSLLQRRFGIGYNRAARLIDTLENRGVIGPANGSTPREVYLKDDE